MISTIQTLDELKAVLEVEKSWPSHLTLIDILHSDVIASGLYVNLEGIAFCEQKAELKEMAENVFEGLLDATKLNDVSFVSADAFAECRLTSLLFRSRVSKCLVRLELV